jgi:hypothetical protein
MIQMSDGQPVDPSVKNKYSNLPPLLQIKDSQTTIIGTATENRQPFYGTKGRRIYCVSDVGALGSSTR